MGVLEQNSRKKLTLGQDGNNLVFLIIINAILFVTIEFIKVIYLLNGAGGFESEVLPNFFVAANANLFLTKPWTLITYMFSDYGLWSFVINMLWLWSFGFILQDLAGNKKLIPVYLYGGFTGALFFLLATNLFPALREPQLLSLAGAGPAIMCVAIATTTLAPKYKIFPLINGGIPLWILTGIFVLINFATVGTASTGYAMAELSAGIIGFVFVWQMQRGNDWSEWMINLVNWADNLFNPEKKYRTKQDKQKLFYKSQQKPFVKTPHVTQQRVDDLLDKIHQKGYSHLTDEEKDFLKKASREEL